MNRRDCIASAALVLFAGVCAAATPRVPPTKPLILVLGDSISAEYGLARGTGWVALLEKQIADEKINTQVINASISGDTTSGGRSRLEALLKKHEPTVVIIELGGNDALRGLPLKNTEDNLAWMVERSTLAGAKPMLVGMQVPPNYGPDYTKRFEQTFASVAKSSNTPLVPFLLKGVADQADPTALFQADRIHPNAKAQPILLGNVWPTLKPMLLKR